jgi:hypothetical protein
MDSFYGIFFFIQSHTLFANHIPPCLGFRVDMVSNLDPVYIIFALSLFNNDLATLVKCLGDSTINVHRNYGGVCIRSALSKLPIHIQAETTS